MKGIVMDVKRKYVIVMSNNGGFYRARKEEAYGVGKEILFTPLPEKSQPFSFSNWKVKVSSIAAACTVLGGILFAAIPGTVPVYAYVSIDINPSVEFSVGNNWTVIKTTFTNKDGKDLLSTLPNIQGESIDAAFDQIIFAAKKEGKLQDKGNVWITSVLANQNQPEAPAINELKQLQTELETKEKVQIQVGTTTEKIRNDAEQLGISPEKYVYFQNATKLGISTPFQNMENDSVSKLESVLQEKNNTSVTTNPGSQKASKTPEESKKSGGESSNAAPQGKKQIVNTPDVKNTETPSNTRPSNRKQNATDRQKKSDNENQHAK